MVKEIIPSGVNEPLRPQVNEEFAKLRASLSFSQRKMAELLGVSQGQIAKWEKGDLKPPGQIFARLADFTQDSDQRAWWLALAGVRIQPKPDDKETRSVPLLRDAAAAGTPRAVDETEIERYIRLPKDWLPRGGTIFAIRVAGDSMSPILESGYIVLLDTTQRDASKLAGRMIVARERDEITIKWLRHQNPIYLLVPQNTAPEHQIRVMREEDDSGIVGAVVKWIGEPPSPRK